VSYHSAFIFKYSERKHTIAARKYPDDVSEAVKSERVSRLVELQKRISLQKNRDVVGRTFPVLVEGDAKKSASQWMGRTDGGITVVWQKEARAVRPGDLIPIRITDATATTLIGTPT